MDKFRKVFSWLKSKPTYALLILAAIVISIFVLFNDKGVIIRIRLEMQKKEAMQRLHELEKENEELERRIKALQEDPKEVERVAREKYGMAQEGETVYKITPSDSLRKDK